MIDLDIKTKKFEKALKPILKNLKKEMIILLAEFPTTDGFLDSLNFSNAQLLQFNESLLQAIETSGLNELVGQELGEMRNVLKERTKELKKMGFSSIVEIKSSDLDNIINMQATDMGLVTEDVSNKIIRRLQSQVLGGESFKDATAELTAVLESDMTRYTETWLKTSYQQYIQKTEDLLADKIGFGENDDDVWEYVGAPLQTNSHSECIWALRERKDNLFTTEEKRAFQNGTAYSSQPAPPRYNCQHYFAMSSKRLKKLSERE